jgi:hypothetical protein
VFKVCIEIFCHPYVSANEFAKELLAERDSLLILRDILRAKLSGIAKVCESVLSSSPRDS